MAISDADLEKIAREYQIPLIDNKPKYPHPDATAFVLLSNEINRRRASGEQEPNESIHLYKKLSERLALKFSADKEAREKARKEKINSKRTFTSSASPGISPSAKSYLARKDIFGD